MEKTTTQIIEGYKAQIKELALALVDAGGDHYETKYADKAKEYIGTTAVIMYKLDKGYELSEEDINYIRQNLH